MSVFAFIGPRIKIANQSVWRKMRGQGCQMALGSCTTRVRRLCDIAISGKGVFQHCTAGKIHYFHPEHRLHFIDSCPDCVAAAIEAILAEFFHNLSPVKF